MTDAYREKLLNWFTNMLVLILTTVMSFVIIWFHNAARDLIYSNNSTLYFTFHAGDPILSFAIVFIPIFLWHVFDFFQKDHRMPSVERLLGKYRYLLGAMILVWLSNEFANSDFLNDLGCPQATQDNTYGFDGGCGSPWPEWKIWPVILLLGVLYLLPLVKGVVSVRSLLRKPAK